MKKTIYCYKRMDGSLFEFVDKSLSTNLEFIGTRTIELEEPQKIHSFTEEQLIRAWERCGKNFSSIMSSDSITFHNFLKELGVR
jgi:hypothetical protein